VIRPEQEHIDAVISECRKPVIVSGEGFAFEAVGYHESVIAALADDLDAMRAAQADAIKAAVAARENEVLSELAQRGFGGVVAELARKWGRSGADAPGAAGKDGGR